MTTKSPKANYIISFSQKQQAWSNPLYAWMVIGWCLATLTFLCDQKSKIELSFYHHTIIMRK
jgi:hypothetical protein